MLKNRWLLPESKTLQKLENKSVMSTPTMCPMCKFAKGSQYYEGILQIRRPNEEILKFVENTIAEMSTVGISKKEKVPNGLDFYLSSNRAVLTLGKKLQQKFGGVFKSSNKLYGQDRQNSKLLYRMTALFQPWGFQQGEVIEIEGRLLLIKKIGKKTGLIDLKTGEKTEQKLNLNHSSLPTTKTVVSIITPRIEVLDPETFQSVPVQNPDRKRDLLKAGDTVKIIKRKNRVYLI